MAAPARSITVFLRRLLVFMVAMFGVGTLFSNGTMAFLATPEGRAQIGPIPYPMFLFDFLMGWLYLAEAYGIGWRRRWAHVFAWTLAVLHSFAASGLWLWYLSGHPVRGSALVLVLAREGFWVLIGLYLWRSPEFGAAGASPKRTSGA